MLKAYLHAFISMDYVPVLPIPAFMIFILAAFYFKTRIPALRICVMVLAVILAALMILFYWERGSISSRLRKFRNVSEYNDSYIIGKTFMLEDRMLVYDRHKILEFYYKDLRELKASPGRRDNWNVEYISDAQNAGNETSSEKQTARLAAFLKSKNPDLKITGIEPEGDAILSHIESGKDQPVI